MSVSVFFVFNIVSVIEQVAVVFHNSRYAYETFRIIKRIIRRIIQGWASRVGNVCFLPKQMLVIINMHCRTLHAKRIPAE